MSACSSGRSLEFAPTSGTLPLEPPEDQEPKKPYEKVTVCDACASDRGPGAIKQNLGFSAPKRYLQFVLIDIRWPPGATRLLACNAFKDTVQRYGSNALS